MKRFKRTGRTACASAALVLLALMTCPPAASSKALKCAPVTEAKIASLFVVWNDALKTATPDKPEKVVNLYAKDAILLPTVENGPMIGRAAISKYFEHFLKDKPSGTIDKRTIHIGCNLAFDAGLYTFAYDPPTGPKDPTKARYTYVYQYDGGRWLIAHHHSSKWPVPPK